MSLTVYEDLEQGSPEWLLARCGILTASNVGSLLTPTLKIASSETSRAIQRLLTAERITGHVEEVFVSADMERGMFDEPLARDLYSTTYAPVTELGFMVREIDGYKLGYSPDGLVGEDGLIEIKSRKQKIHLKTILDDSVPTENMAQIQAGLLVSGREWCDYLSYCGGMPMYRIRVLPDPAWQEAIIGALAAFETQSAIWVDEYLTRTEGLPSTERIDHFGVELKL
ncbi:lambda exonuclease family protein [Timonella senegalensis]|uniref:lambda exonuclease family protein n=1 Tax=Timonella senegalensis TaxID=1465825 RepID=UPI002FDC91B4